MANSFPGITVNIFLAQLIPPPWTPRKAINLLVTIIIRPE
jgi:hypothetical protein